MQRNTLETPGNGLLDLSGLKNRADLIVCSIQDAPSIGGRRSFIDYLDFGAREATGGALSAQFLRLNDDLAQSETTGWHYHTIDLQLTYILSGWFDIQFEDGAIRRLHGGTFTMIPKGHKHNELGASKGTEVFEILLGEMGTVPCDPPPGAEIPLR
jgi:hypothetical protein